MVLLERDFPSSQKKRSSARPVTKREKGPGRSRRPSFQCRERLLQQLGRIFGNHMIPVPGTSMLHSVFVGLAVLLGLNVAAVIVLAVTFIHDLSRAWEL